MEGLQRRRPTDVRIAGDWYQWCVAWRACLRLLVEQSEPKAVDPVIKVGVEVRGVGNLDDVVLYRDSNRHTYCQVKYSVDASSPLNSESLIGQPGDKSLLRSIAHAWRGLSATGAEPDLTLITTKAVDHRDPLLSGLDTRTGYLMPAAAEGTSRGRKGVARSAWADSVGLSEPELLQLLSVLRFETALTPQRLDEELLLLMRSVGFPAHRAALDAAVGWVQRQVRNSRRELYHADIIDACAELWPEQALTRKRVTPQELILRITPNAVTLIRPDHAPEVHDHPGVGAQLEDLLWRLRQNAVTKGSKRGASPDLYTAVGFELARTFLSEPLGMALAAEIENSERFNSALHLALDICDELAGLPWETLLAPGGSVPLALHPKIRLYRRTEQRAAAPSARVPGPLRILAIMASPDGEALLDYEAEQNRILDALQGARDEGAYVRFLNSGTLEELSRALRQERFHVLHISCHASDGVLIFEDEHGRPVRVGAARLAREVLQADRTPSLVSLSGCGTALGDGTESLARALTAGGVPMVFATTAPITDRYATDFAGELYRALADSETPDVLTAFCDTRRALEADQTGDLPAEWVIPALFVRGPIEPLYERPNVHANVSDDDQAPLFADGIATRPLGEFVGRRAEKRILRRVLRGKGRGCVIHGLGGSGKTSLATELLRDGNEKALIVAVSGRIDPSSVLCEISSVLYDPAASERNREFARFLGRSDEPWVHRFAALRRRVLGKRQVILLLDGFDANLRPSDTGWEVVGSDLAAFLTAWIRSPGLHRVLFTSRYIFQLPEQAERRLSSHHLGPLTLPEVRKLIWRLPGLNSLTVGSQARILAAIGGHPRTLEFLDALLGSEARFDDVRELMDWLNGEESFFDAPRDLASAIEAAISLTIADTGLTQLLESLDELGRSALVGGSVHRRPVDAVGLAWATIPITEVPSYLDSDQRVGPDFRGSVGWPMTIVGEERINDEWMVRVSDFEHVTAFKIAESNEFNMALDGLEERGLLIPEPSAKKLRILRTYPWVGEAASQGKGVQQAHWVAAEFLLTRAEFLSADYRAAVAIWIEAAFHLRSAGKADQAIQLTISSAQRLIHWGSPDNAREICEVALAQQTDRLDDEAEVRALLGRIAQLNGDWDGARHEYDRVLKIYRDQGDLEGIAVALHQSGTLHEQLGDLDEAHAVYTEALAHFEKLGNAYQIAATTGQIGAVAHRLGRHEEASAHYARAMETVNDLDDSSLTLRLLHQASVLAQDSGDWDSAESGYQRCLDIAQSTDDKLAVAAAFHQLGVVAQLRNDLTTALKYTRHAFSLSERLRDIIGMGLSLGLIGLIHETSGEYDLAVGYTVQSLAVLTDSSGRPVPEASNSINRLAAQRRALGPHKFNKVLSRHTDPATTQWINEVLDLSATPDP
jgi:tetratricopeptide (TPR) repeat protein